MKFKSKLIVGIALAAMAGPALAFSGAGAVTSAAVARPSAHGWGDQNIPAPAPPGVYAPAAPGASVTYSSNWSGYAQTGPEGTFTAVEDTWTVPTVNTAASGDQYSADWVGIGGYSDDTLIQDGTEADNINGKAHYDAWTEILPASEDVLTGLTINPGDEIKATVVETSANSWTMAVHDLTTGKGANRKVTYDSNGESAEAVHERPEVGSGLANLAQTTNVTFSPGESSIAAPGTPSYKPLLKAVTGGSLYQMFMVNNQGTATIASPSAPSTNKEGFTIADGSTSPPAP
jgi:hypothetical protein